METVIEEEFRLEDNLNKCRCCFRTLIDEQKFTKITKAIEQKFFDLTSIKLFEASVFSSKICTLCSNDLEVFSQFRKDLCRKQRELYQTLREKETEIAQHIFNDVKSEVNEFIDCNPRQELAQDDIYFHPQVAIKSEDVEELQDFESLIDPVERSKRKENYKEKNKKHFDIKQNKENVKDNNSIFCDVCGHASSLKADLEIHMRENHTKKEPQSFYCEFCSREFEKRHLLNRHIKLKHTEKKRSHLCPTCNKSFFTISTLKKHTESHSAKNMPCEFCGKLFSCMNNLRTHLYYHSDPKFICEFEGCGKKFFMRKLLKAHLNVHRGLKEFQCSYCEKSYFFQSHLKRHVLSSHMKLKIDCAVATCSSSFARKETYRNHVLQHHSNHENLESLLTKIRNMKVEEFRCVG